jgi:hypothetical protein
VAAADKITPALASALEALKLARREVAEVERDPERWRWVSVGLVTALKCAAIAALSAYETANDADTLDLKSPTKVAPLKLLLRRARSDEFLLPPEQLPATARQIEAVLRLAAYRNDVLHGGAGDRAASIVGDANTCVILIRHFLEGAPAFDPSDYAVHCALVSDELTAIEAALRQPG